MISILDVLALGALPGGNNFILSYHCLQIKPLNKLHSKLLDGGSGFCFSGHGGLEQFQLLKILAQSRLLSHVY